MARNCGPDCWIAEGTQCDCICAGAMHGKQGERTRSIFRALTGSVPTTPAQLLEASYKALQTAQAAGVRDRLALTSSARKLLT